MNLRQIEAFKAFMECGTVTQTADRLFISQPAASKLLSAFERANKFRVFERSHGRLLPTPEAHLLYSEVERVFAGLDEISKLSNDIGELRRGRMAIGVLPALSAGFIQKVIANFLYERANVTISMQTRTSQKIVQSVAARKLDIGVTSNPPDYTGVTSEHLTCVPGVCAIPANHILAKRDKITPRDLRGEPFISLTAMDRSRERIESSFLQGKISPNVIVETPLSSSACAFVAEGVGIAIVDPFSPKAFADGRIVLRPYTPVVNFDIYLSRPSDTSLSILAQAFVELLKTAFDSLDAGKLST